MVAWVAITSAIELAFLLVTVGLLGYLTKDFGVYYLDLKDFTSDTYSDYPYRGEYYRSTATTTGFSASTTRSPYGERHTLHRRSIYANDSRELYAWSRLILGLAIMMLFVYVVRSITLLVYLIKYYSAWLYDRQDARKRKSFRRAGLATNEDDNYGTNIHRQSLEALRPYFKVNIWSLVLMFIFGFSFVVAYGLMWNMSYRIAQALIAFWTVTFAFTILTTVLIWLEIKSIRRQVARESHGGMAIDGYTTAGSKEMATTPSGASVQPTLPQAQQPQVLHSPSQQMSQTNTASYAVQQTAQPLQNGTDPYSSAGNPWPQPKTYWDPQRNTIVLDYTTGEDYANTHGLSSQLQLDPTSRGPEQRGSIRRVSLSEEPELALALSQLPPPPPGLVEQINREQSEARGQAFLNSSPPSQAVEQSSALAQHPPSEQAQGHDVHEPPPQFDAQTQATPLFPQSQSTQYAQDGGHSTGGAGQHSSAGAAGTAQGSTVSPAPANAVLLPNVFFDEVSGKLYMSTAEGLKPLPSS